MTSLNYMYGTLELCVLHFNKKTLKIFPVFFVIPLPCFLNYYFRATFPTCTSPMDLVFKSFTFYILYTPLNTKVSSVFTKTSYYLRLKMIITFSLFLCVALLELVASQVTTKSCVLIS